MTSPDRTASSAARFLTAARGGTVDRAPVWLMRQAGRYLPEYQALRRQHDFVTCCRTPALAAEISLQPWRRFGMDGVVVFCDILMPLMALGIDFTVVEAVGPILTPAITTIEQLRTLRTPNPKNDYAYLTATLSALRETLGERAAVIGFCGAPWTVATYLFSGGRTTDHAALIAHFASHPEFSAALFDTLVPMLTDYLVAQARAGAHVVQIFDTWAGLLSAEQYAAIAAPPLARLINGFRAATDDTVPVIVYGNDCGHLLPQFAQLSPSAVSIDWRTSLTDARNMVGSQIALQGNLDPQLLLTDCDTIRAATTTMLAAGGRTGYIANLGHGVIKETSPEQVACFVQTVQRS